MRLLALAFALVLGTLAAAPSRASVFGFTATLRIHVATVASVSLYGAGYGESVGGGLVTLPSGAFSNSTTYSAPIVPTLLGLTSLTAPAGIANATGSMNPSGAMALSGTLFFNSGAAGYIPLAPIGGGVDQPGTVIGQSFTLQGATWMGGSQVFTYMGNMLGVPFSAAATAYDNRTANGDGIVQLVAPAVANFGLLGTVPVFGVLTIDYTPEPSTLVLLGAGVAALAGMGGSRRVRRR